MPQGESCVDVSNAILRLECFDQAYEISSPEDLSAEKAVNRFFGSVFYESPDATVHMFSQGDDPCNIVANVASVRNGSGKNRAVFLISNVHLSHVKRIAFWRGPELVKPGAVLLETETEFPAR